MPDIEPASADARTAEFTARFPGLCDVPEVNCGDQPMFYGGVRARTARQATAAGELTVMATTFDAGAGTVWHTHESDQTLVLLSGAGAVEDDRGVHPLRAGDVVTIPRGRRHRHLADAERSMTHLSITTHGNHHICSDAAQCDCQRGH
ncbi:cupin domain-containing protein [Saccharopolyspora erythraea]|uniref:cupin domain-containing protein n=1 Tax=Saccharopolyspora erythraea TaxID=1836 RepID=UPI001BA8D5CB|nr:cupin domain-containing protein [Saccharopolyspora erythraea]QUH03784.1 cupin domain-containing protein [Saccharopolyspora erythraea]